ncbi:hypothetical protein TNCV_2961771 [Trichonephila clavipes]|nr:hypothetical protein TNCV_2961771 [Trichonephila clavipes]
MRKIAHAGSTARSMVNISMEAANSPGQIYDELAALQGVFPSLKLESNSIEMWCKFFQKEEAPNLLKIVQFVCSVPVSNAFVERIFSVMGNGWTDERNRLAVNTFHDITRRTDRNPTTVMRMRNQQVTEGHTYGAGSTSPSMAIVRENRHSMAPSKPLVTCLYFVRYRPVPGVMVWATIGLTTRTSLVRIDGNFTRLLPGRAQSPDLSPIENIWSLVAERLDHNPSPANTVDEVWHIFEAAWNVARFGHPGPFDSESNWIGSNQI